MDLPDLIVLILGLVGLTLITSTGGVFRSFKQKIKNPMLMEFSMCPMCQGFWIGLLGHVLYFWSPFDVWFWIWSVIFGGMVSMLSMVCNKLIS